MPAEEVNEYELERERKYVLLPGIVYAWTIRRGAVCSNSYIVVHNTDVL
jgi:hypothetical protein